MKEKTVSTKETWTQIAIRLPDTFLERLDKLAEKLSQPGLSVTRVEALRVAAHKGLEQFESEKKKK